MIEFKGVNKSFYKNTLEIQALKDIDLKVAQKDIYGVIGYSGAGKSTLIRLVNQLEKPTSGDVIVDGQRMNQLKPKQLRLVKKDIGMIFQHFNLLNSKSVFYNVAIPLILQKRSKSYINQKVSEMLAFVGLEDKGKQFPNELSGGQKQRVAIARALVTDPKILLCDEATSALDPSTTESILNLLRKVNQSLDVTILLITHEMSVIQQICNKVAVMERGRVIEHGDVLKVLGHPQTETAKSFISTIIKTDLPESLKAHLPSTQNVVDIKLYLEGKQIGDQILQHLIRNLNLDVNLIYASMTEIQGTSVGYLTLRFNEPTDQINKAYDYFNIHNIEYEEVI
ncbi:methionine ABC transporter ATP-binding protein [Staphylococcus massiliensis]|uniref:methionine ABC transporter ATP-binding protein n=1 Tax=Staphylococcus massiliensis TaxID=555791 RepID=UPI001EDF5CAA|nr:ATP-binding cassette domain-containing protein [Staphylococcus massiliensis]MCG3411766.1 ATP-binding cassette domain-containing protein [Staphylococcus massiliensis]